MVYLYSVENVVTLGKIDRYVCVLSPLLFILLKTPKNTRNDLARPIMGTIFLVVLLARTVTHTH